MFKKILLSLLAMTILCLFFGTVYFLYSKSQEKPEVYETTSAFRTTIVNKTVATGKIQPRKEVAIKPQVSGVIDKLYVEAGDIIRKGDVIARIELIPDLEQLNRAESQLETAKINFKNTQIEYERQKSLFDQKLIGEIEFNRFVLNYELQKESVKSAEDNVALIREGAAKGSDRVANIVHSTVDGMVLDLPWKEGAFVIETNTFNEGSTVATVANMNDLIFEGRMDESEVGKISEGMALKLSVGAIEDAEFDAALEYISPKGLEDQGTIKFQIRAAIVLKQGQFLRSGYSANAEIVLDKREDILAINEGNLITQNGNAYVEIEKEDQIFERREIQVGLSDGINIEVLSGLTEQDRFKKRVN